MIVRPSMICDVRSFGAVLDIPDMFLFFLVKKHLPVSPMLFLRAVVARDLINNVGLKIDLWAEF